MSETRAEIRLPTQELRDDIPFFTQTLGMRMDMIYPADSPRIAVFSGHGLRIRVEKDALEAPGTIRILSDNPDHFADGQRRLTAPNGTCVEIEELNPPLVVPATQHSFVTRRLADGAPWIVGRAGMQYRDLIPDRLGGSIIASHIRIRDAGPVPDMVHYHKVGFQLIFCVSGWVDVLYEDQGGLRRIHAGDCFIQPPEIRHRVVEASDNLQVIEIGVPAEHVTEVDHDMDLPTTHERPDREWHGQRFVHNIGKDAPWAPHRLPGYIARDTTIAINTQNVAGVWVARPGDGAPQWTAHDADIHFTYVMSGTVTLQGEGRDPQPLERGDAFVIPPFMKTRLSDPSAGLELLEVALPGDFKTETA
ncbi:cupin domain-containing protein [Alisedimentitalea sp. MJ-SS2]|uniref:cupin domain-containing protein n=1 Tax=Aliisedimentitalea sp. MJ-SS2 TaxID=3049795 RepID=UPI00291264A7|nr:cupin domain-containing protein [Alisedimentitalea sp. MJ-SS2]MDU8929896.1 cupin domain-containing protein [Alisedimentitalea sp. MJ-SS2]